MFDDNNGEKATRVSFDRWIRYSRDRERCVAGAVATLHPKA